MVIKYEKKKIDMNIFILRIKYPQLELTNRVFNLILTNNATNNIKVQLYYSSNISNVFLSVMSSSLIFHSELDSPLSFSFVVDFHTSWLIQNAERQLLCIQNLGVLFLQKDPNLADFLILT